MVPVDIPEPRYTLFDSTRDDLPEVVVVNGALQEFRRTEAFPWHLRIRIEATDLGNNGMPTPAESALLYEVGDEIEAAIFAARTESNTRNVLFLARSTWNGVRELHFQVHDAEVVNAALSSLITADKRRREWEFKMTHDPHWQEAGNLFRFFPRTHALNG